MSKSQVQKILAAVVTQKLGGGEMAVLCKLLTLPEYRIDTVKALHGEWTHWERHKKAEAVAKYGEPLPHSKATIYRAVDALKKRGWLEEKFASHWQTTDGILSLVPMLIIGGKPEPDAKTKTPATPKARTAAAKKKTAKKKAAGKGGRRG